MEKNGLLVTDSHDKRDTFLALSPRMRHLRFAALIAVLSGSLSASGQTQLGYVKTKGRLNFNGSVTAGQKLSGAVVTVLNGNNVMSDDDGKFSLKLSAPQFVLKSVTKKNYVLCDPDLLKKQYSYSTNDFVIVMEDELEKAIMGYAAIYCKDGETLLCSRVPKTPKPVLDKELLRKEYGSVYGKYLQVQEAVFDEPLFKKECRELYDQYLVTPEAGEPEFKIAYPRKTSSRKTEAIF